MARGYPDWSGPKVGVYLQPEWAAKEGVDKTFVAGGANLAFGGEASVAYTVPSGKTLYITQASTNISASAAASGDLNQICRLCIWRSGVGDLIDAGGNGGVALTFPKPLAIPAGALVDFLAYSYCNHAVDINLSIGGYEI